MWMWENKACKWFIAIDLYGLVLKSANIFSGLSPNSGLIKKWIESFHVDKRSSGLLKSDCIEELILRGFYF